MDIKEIALKVGLQAFEEHPYDEGHVVSPSGYTWIDDKLIEFAEALIEAYKAELLKEVGEPVGLVTFVDGECYAELSDTAKLVEFDELFTSDQVAAAIQQYKDSLLKDVGEPVAYMTTDEEGSASMLFFDEQEARQYSGDDEPIKLIVKPGE